MCFQILATRITNVQVTMLVYLGQSLFWGGIQVSFALLFTFGGSHRHNGQLAIGPFN